MASGWVVPTGLRLLLDDIMHVVLDDDRTTTIRLTRTRQQLYRLIADALETWLDQRTQLQLKTTTTTTLQLHESAQIIRHEPRKNSTSKQ